MLTPLLMGVNTTLDIALVFGVIIYHVRVTPLSSAEATLY
jgi:hypothetical protein